MVVSHLVSLPLRHIADFTQLIVTTEVHQIYFPFSIALALHATRVSVAHQQNVWSSGSWSQINWPTYLAGYLVMAWAGSFWSHILLGAYPPPLYSINPWIGYISINILVAAIFHIIPSIREILTPRNFDTIFFPIDAILRLGSITTTLDLVHTHPNPQLSQSLFLRFFACAVASAGGGITAATFAVWTPDWCFSTPVFLKGGVVDTVDVWGGMFAAFVYGIFTASHPTYQHMLLSYSITTQKGPILTPLGARSAATVALMAISCWKVIIVYWIPLTRRITEKKTKTE